MTDIYNRGLNIAVRYLERNDYLVFDKNYQFENCEVSIVAYKDDVLIFIWLEVYSSISEEAQEKIKAQQKYRQCQKAAKAYVYEKKLANIPVQFDKIVVYVQDEQIRHYENISNRKN